jgi:hypothetical protein
MAATTSSPGAAEELGQDGQAIGEDEGRHDRNERQGCQEADAADRHDLDDPDERVPIVPGSRAWTA